MAYNTYLYHASSATAEISERDIGSYTLLRLTPSTERLPWDDLCKILHGGQRMGKVQNGEEILPKVLTPE